jgi:hypothetical protein
VPAGFLAAGWSLLVLGVCVAAMASVLRKRIRLVCRLFAEAGEALGSDSARGLDAATAAALALFAVVVAWHTALLASLISIGGAAGGSLVFWYVVFSGYWMSLVVLGLYKVCVSGAVAHWYFARGVAYLPPSSPDPPAVLALRAGLTTSFGSIAFGALVVTTLSVASWMLRRARAVSRAAAATRRAAGLGESTTQRIVYACTGCIDTLLAVAAQLAERANRLAFIHIAMHGFSFCVASTRVLRLIQRHPVDLPLVDLVTRFALFAGKAVGTCVVTLFALASRQWWGER